MCLRGLYTNLLSTSIMPRRFNLRKSARSFTNVRFFRSTRYVASAEICGLSAVKEKYGSDYEEANGDDSDSDSETEDEDGEELTPAVDAAILRTLSRIQKKDPAIYDSNQSVFEGMLL
jgi:hypothetical protein